MRQEVQNRIGNFQNRNMMNRIVKNSLFGPRVEKFTLNRGFDCTTVFSMSELV